MLKFRFGMFIVTLLLLLLLLLLSALLMRLYLRIPPMTYWNTNLLSDVNNADREISFIWSNQVLNKLLSMPSITFYIRRHIRQRTCITCMDMQSHWWIRTVYIQLCWNPSNFISNIVTLPTSKEFVKIYQEMWKKPLKKYLYYIYYIRIFGCEVNILVCKIYNSNKILPMERGGRRKSRLEEPMFSKQIK